METHELYLCDLVEDARIQPRASIHQPTVNQYCELYQDGAEMPAIRVVAIDESDDGDGAQMYVVDGFHRVVAARQAGLKSIQCKVTDGTMDEAIKIACGANATHGRPLSIEDTERAVTLLLEAGVEDGEIARTVGKSLRTVQRVKKRHDLQRSYVRVYDKAQDEATQEAIKSLAKQFPEEIEMLRKGEITTSPEELQKFAALDRQHRQVLAPLVLGKSLSVEAAKDIADMRPNSEDLPMASFINFALNSDNNPDEGGETWTFRNQTVRCDIVTIQS